MPRYFISFDNGTMHIPDGALEEMSHDAHAVKFDAQAAGVWVTGGGFFTQRATIAHPDGTMSDGAEPEIKAVLGGFVVLELPDRDAAHHWALRIAKACRCPQDVRVLIDDPLV